MTSILEINKKGDKMKYNINSEEDIWDLEEELYLKYDKRRNNYEMVDNRNY